MMFDGCLSARGKTSVVAMAIVEMMIDMPIEMFRSVEPRTSADEYAAREPFRTVIAIRSAVVRRDFVVPVRTYGWCSNLDSNLRGGAVTSRHCANYG